jgi:hypothetical protein
VGGVNAQRVLEISSSPGCASCRIELERLLTIEDSEPFWLGGVVSLARDPQGRYHGTSSPVTPGEIHVLDAGGRRIARYGGEGSGPGEGLRTSAPVAFDRADTAYVYDVRLNRFSVWSPSFEFVRSFNGPPPDQAAIFTEDRQLLMPSFVPTREGIGWPLHIVDPVTGAIVRSFGSDSPVQPLGRLESNRRRLAASKGRLFWAAHLTQNRIEQWTIDGQRLLEIRRNVDWFEPHDGRLTEDGVTGSYIRGIHEDADGLLWVFIQVPDVNYSANRRRMPDPGDGMGPRPGGAMAFHGLLDVIVEVIDPRDGTLVASRRFDQNIRTLGNGAPLHSFREAADASPIYDVYRVRLVR